MQYFCVVFKSLVAFFVAGAALWRHPLSFCVAGAALQTSRHFTLYTFTLHSTLFTLHFTLHTLHSTLYTPDSTLHTPHFTLHTLHSTLYTLHFTLYTPHSTLHTLHFTLHTPHFALHPLPHSTVHWYGNGETCTRLSKKHVSQKSVLRDCIRVRGLHIVFCWLNPHC